MNIIIFILILGILIFVHELGHFLFAKLFKVRVDEFGFGYPPRAFTIGKWKETVITFNWIPFGGFVKLFGEQDLGEELTPEEKKTSLVYKPRWQQFLVMFGGILFNIIFAWILFAVTYTQGLDVAETSAPEGYTFDTTELTVTHVLPESPASEGGLQAGDIVKEYGNDDTIVTIANESREDFVTFVNEIGINNESMYIVVLRNEKLKALTVTPEEGVIEGGYGIGIGLDRVGELKLPFFKALGYSVTTTWNYLKAITLSFIDLISGKVSLNAVSGPVGIVSQVGEASKIGLSYLIGFAALLSLNLAVLNAFPFPALDGGRILILLLEAIIQKRIKPTITAWINTIGFFILIAFMLFITVKDILHLI